MTAPCWVVKIGTDHYGVSVVISTLTAGGWTLSRHQCDASRFDRAQARRLVKLCGGRVVRLVRKRGGDK